MNHASDFIKFHCQDSATIQATLVRKYALDKEAHALGFQVRKFLSDNGVFAAMELQKTALERLAA